MVMQVIDSPDFAKRDVTSVKSISYGGAPCPPDLVRRITEHFPAGSPGNGYGLTETSAMTAVNNGNNYIRKPTSVGPPSPVCDVAVVPESFEGAEPPVGQSVDPERTGASYLDQGSQCRPGLLEPARRRPRRPSARVGCTRGRRAPRRGGVRPS